MCKPNKNIYNQNIYSTACDDNLYLNLKNSAPNPNLMMRLEYTLLFAKTVIKKSKK